MERVKTTINFIGGILLIGLLLLALIKIFGTLIPQLMGEQQSSSLPVDSAYPPIVETDIDSAYPPPNKTVQSPSPTTEFTDIPFQDLITRTIIPITPYRTLTLRPGTSATPVPFIEPAQDSSGTILFISQADNDTPPGLFGLDVDSGGSIITLRGQISNEKIRKDTFLFSSPDGRSLAVTGDWGVWNIYNNVQGQLRNTSYTLGGEAIFFNWFPDNRKFLWGEGALFLEDSFTGERARLASAGYGRINGATASPDGRYVVYSYSTDVIYQSGLWLIEGNGQNPYLLSAGVSSFNIAWSPDGKQIAFWGKGWEVMDADGSNRRTIAEGVTLPQCYPLPPLWSPDSRMLVVVTSKAGDSFCKGWGEDIFNGTNIILIDVESGKASPLLSDGITGNIDPTWSPDGSQLAFVSNRSGSPALWAVKTDGSNLRQLNENSTLARFPVWCRLNK